MREVAVLGVGMTRFGKSSMTQLEMFSEAALQAITESNLSPRDVQALFIGAVYGGFSEGQMNLAAYAAEAIGARNVPATRFEGACASASVAIRDAINWVGSGVHDIVIAGGTERTLVLKTDTATRYYQMSSDAYYEAPTGLTFPGVFAMLANMYAHAHRVPLDVLKRQMALVAVKAHRNAMKNPKAQFHKEITVDDVLSSAMVASPLQLYDCCPFTDGAAAIVLADGATARKLVTKPVYVAGMGQASAGGIYTQRELPRIKARELAMKQAYSMAAMGPRDIDVVELHDCFTIAEIVATESMGFFEYGDGAGAVERGETEIGGKVAVNPSGGLKAKGHPIGATGAAQVYEIAKQLRGECAERQVEGAKVGLTDTLGGDLATVVDILWRI